MSNAINSVLRLAILAGLVVVVYGFVFRPPALRRLGRKAMLVGYLYVASVIISAILRVRFGWGV